MNLLEILNKNKSDKGASVKNSHHYYLEYEKEFEKYRNENINILEIGIFKGTSISSWLEYFTKAKIYCIDIFTRINENEIECLKSPRVFWIKQDSTKSDLFENFISNWGDVQFDFIIDDGLHTPDANLKTFNNTYPFLKNDGVYYIEDVWMLNRLTEKEKNHHWLRKNSIHYTDNLHEKLLKALPNYEEIDFRKKSGILDSYLLKIKKNKS